MRYLLLALCFFWSSGDLSAKPRALVVGIDTYNDVLNRDRFSVEHKLHLDKPDKDAVAIAETLKNDYGYSVSLLADPGGDTSRPAILAKWKELLESAQNGDVVLFYFAGHGAELKGNNYLVPRDAKYDWKLPDQERLDVLTSSSIELQTLIKGLADAKRDSDKNKDLIGIFILDACRENPFDAGQLAVTLGPYVVPSRQLFIMFSAGVGQTAKEAKNAPNSVFAEELLKLLKNKDMALSELAQNLRFNVNEAALGLSCDGQPCGEQIPSYYDQLLKRLTITGVETKAQPASNNAKRAGTEKANAAERSLGLRGAVMDCPYCPELVVLSAGSFQMGSDGKEKGHRANEGPRHRVAIGKRFAIGKYEVTYREWAACVREGHGDCRDLKRDDQKPVADVSWSDADRYLQWLNRKTGATYRLATEAEWEYAARAGTETPYFFEGSEAKLLCEYANGADKSAGVLPYAYQTCDDGVGRDTSIIGRYRPNKWGLYDMAGNVWEWVQDCWHENYDKAPADGSSWQEASCARRVARGGSWRSGADALRSAVRNAFPPSHQRPTLGFRVVREIAQ
ncbi:MAG: SUMF1/EgtB/PvdO family nonheme iron enzyme [Rhodomicrobium sp.]